MKGALKLENSFKLQFLILHYIIIYIQNHLRIEESYLMNYMKRIAGGEYVGFNNAVYLSERETADRNFAMGFYMKENKCFPKGERHVLQKSMELYFQACSIEANTETLAVMGATLANGGICPTTGEKVSRANINPNHIES